MSDPGKDLFLALYREHRGKVWGAGAGVLVALIIGLLGWKIFLVLIFGAVGYLVGKYVDEQRSMEEHEHTEDQPKP